TETSESSGAYTMYEWPTTQSTSDAAQYTSPGWASYMFGIDHRSATACPPLSRTTPLGTAVVPEVYRMYKGSVAATGTQPIGSAPAIASPQSTSRPEVSGAVACSRWRTTQLEGRCEAISMARSSIGLYSMTLSTSIPHDALTTTFGFASSIRTASSCGANPPKTTEWT